MAEFAAHFLDGLLGLHIAAEAGHLAVHQNGHERVVAGRGLHGLDAVLSDLDLVAEALEELRQKAGMVKVLGTYPAWSDD